jgi:hypothetical protein
VTRDMEWMHVLKPGPSWTYRLESWQGLELLDWKGFGMSHHTTSHRELAYLVNILHGTACDGHAMKHVDCFLSTVL